MHVTIMKEEAMNLKDSKERSEGMFEGRRGKGKV